MQVQPEIVVGIISFFGIGLIGIVQTLKRILKVQGWGAIILTLVVSFLATGIYLAYAQMFSILALVIYGFVVFGEASGLYHVLKKS